MTKERSNKRKAASKFKRKNFSGRYGFPPYMAPSVYQPTPLPPRINLDDLDTRKQLMMGNKQGKIPASVSSSESALPPVKVISSVAERDKILRDQLNQTSKKIIEDDLIDFIESQQKLGHRPEFRAWIRRFHKEYDDSWFESNFVRLENAFLPIWTKLAGQPSNSSKQTDLLDFWDAPSKSDDPFSLL